MRLSVNKNSDRNWACFYLAYVVLSSYSVYMFLNSTLATLANLGILILSALTMLRFNKSRIKKNILAKDISGKVPHSKCCTLRKKLHLRFQQFQSVLNVVVSEGLYGTLFIPVLIIGIFILVSLLTTVDTFSTILRGLRFLMIFYCVVIFVRRDIDLLDCLYRVLFSLMVFYFGCYVIFDILFPGLGLSYIRVPLVNLNGVSTYSLYESHFHIYFRWATSIQFLGIPLKRMSGFCWEPGMYQLYINYVLMYLLFFDKAQKRNWRRIAFSMVNIILCTSSMGLMVAIIFFVVALLQQKSKVLRAVCGFPALLIGIMAIQSVLSAKSAGSAYSYSSRMAELSLLYDVLFQNPVLGSALTKQNGSNGFVRFLWSYGYLSVAVVLFLGVRLAKNKNRIRQVQQKVVFAAWFILSLANEPIEFFNFTFLIVAFLVVDVPNLRTGKELTT